MPRDDRETAGADLVDDIAVGGHPVSTGDDPLHLAGLHQGGGGVIRH